MTLGISWNTMVGGCSLSQMNKGILPSSDSNRSSNTRGMPQALVSAIVAPMAIPPIPMPNRPTAHQMDEASIAAFRSTAPNTWVIREKARDYGVDLEVEIFDGESATGLVFNVQIKASAADGVPRVTLKTSTRNYLNALEVRTLIVHWASKSGEFRFKWNHRVDMFGRKPGARSMTFAVEELWNESTHLAIEAEVRASKAWKNLLSQLPLYWEVVGEGAFLGAHRNALIAALRRRLARHPDLTTSRKNCGKDAQLLIDLQADSVEIRVTGGPGGVLHYKGSPDIGTADVDAIAADIAAGIAYEVGPLGATLLATDLFAASAKDGNFIASNPSVAGQAVFYLARHNQTAGVLAVLDRTYFADSEGSAGPAALVALYRATPEMGRSLVSRLTKRFEDAAARDKYRAGEYLYNAGNIARQTDLDSAEDLYSRAGVALPNYKERDYWWAERAGISFHRGKYAEATDRYQEAIRLGGNDLLPRLAHALMWAGRYGEAIAAFERADNEDMPAYWWVTFWALEHVVRAFEITSQERPAEVSNVSMTSATEHDDETVRDSLSEDLLNWFALWRWADIQRAEGNASAHLYAMAAVVQPKNPVLWFEAFLSMHTEVPDSAIVVLAAAVAECGDEFKTFIIEDEYVPSELRQPLLDLLDELPIVEPPELVMRVGGAPVDIS